MVEAVQIRDKIIFFIRNNGPSLPVQIAKEMGLSILFASAFLSELFGDKIINISNLRVGSSPLYFIPGQEPQLERFSQYIKGKEKEAYLLLKEKKILRDSEQQPAIRVALREIKDFAVPFEKNNEIFWRYFLVEEPEQIIIEEEIEETPKEEVKEEQKEAALEIVEIKEEVHEKEPEEKIIEIKKEHLSKEKASKKPKETSKKTKPSKNDKGDDNFFNKIKEFLSKKNVEILDIKDFKNNEATLKVKKGNGEEALFFVFNKKRITEKEILEAGKKAYEEKMPYTILSFGETTKKLGDLISAVKNLSSFEKIE